MSTPSRIFARKSIMAIFGEMESPEVMVALACALIVYMAVAGII